MASWVEVAETIALARAKHAEESNRPAAARKWRDIAAAVRRLQGRGDREQPSGYGLGSFPIVGF
jgi:hypothetical protein